MDFSPEELDEILRIFKEEGLEHLSSIDKCLLDLEKEPDNMELISMLFREAHSIKGSARMVNADSVQTIAHKMEDLLGLAKDGIIVLDSVIIDIFCKAVDCITDIINSINRENLSVPNPLSNLIVEEIEEVQNNLLTQKKKPEPQIVEERILTPELFADILILLPSLIKNFQNKRMESFLNVLFRIQEFASNIDNRKLDYFLSEIFSLANEYQQQKNEEIYYTLGNEIENLVKLSNSIAHNLGLNPIKFFEKEKKEDDSVTIKQNSNGTTDVLDDAKIKIIMHNVAYINNKHQQTEAVNEIIMLLNDFSKKVAEDEIKEIFSLVKEILLYIKEFKVIPDQESVKIIEKTLDTAFAIANNENSEEDITLIKQGLTILKQMLELNKDNQIQEVIKQTAIQETNGIIKTNKSTFLQTNEIIEGYEAETFKTLRVDTQKLDKLENEVEELIVMKIKNKRHLKHIAEVIKKMTEIQKDVIKSYNYIKYFDKKFYSDSFTSGRTNILKNFSSYIEKINEKTHELIDETSLLQRTLQNDDTRLNFLVDEIENMVKTIRVLPLSTIFHMFPRMVRDIARTSNKQAEIIISGSETSADKTIIEELKSPLIHIIRNALDHGIETPEERIATGKNPTGKIVLSCYYSDNAINIEITDDGRGLDLEKIKEKILRKNILAREELERLTESQLMNVIFWPGFSTEENVTELSGRGVGLDVVHTKISQLNGKVSIKSKAEEGFKILIKIPITLATIKGFLIKTDNQNFAIPSNFIISAMVLKKEDIIKRENKEYIIHDGKSVPLANLSALLNPLNTTLSEKDKYNAVLLHFEDNMLALEVDTFTGTEEILQKRLDAPLIKVKNISGVASLSSGEVCLVLNISDIIKSATENKELSRAKEMLAIPIKKIKQKTILIADDSVTTISLEKNILKSAGYTVVQAVNGLEAYKILLHEKIDLLISDLEMPEMDGLELFEKLEKENISIPTIVLSSFDSKEYREKCTKFAIQEFISKKDFSEKNFLKTVFEILHHEEN
ncbi:MAG: hybrid sensor histidine kinase/response regulator [Candidatus Gastranaerophilales bacterium]|nr:hybrid sensor histidine kinase/response regulator [Candidatus Gastranaerophilales bacterium]